MILHHISTLYISSFYHNKIKCCPSNTPPFVLQFPHFYTLHIPHPYGNDSRFPTSKPQFVLRFLILLQPVFIPGMGKINNQNQLNQQEEECSNHADHHPCCNWYTHTSMAYEIIISWYAFHMTWLMTNNCAMVPVLSPLWPGEHLPLL